MLQSIRAGRFRHLYWKTARRSVKSLQSGATSTKRDERLKTVPFVAGDEFSAADITTLVTIDFAAGGMKMSVPAEFDALQAWYDKVSNRPASKA
nr:glutathione binding-like protein [Paraburkholderia sp. BL10I2N1]